MKYNILEDNRHLILALEGKAVDKDQEVLRFLQQQDKYPEEGRFRIPFSQAEKTLKLLGATGCLFWKGKKVFVDPFARMKVSFEVDEQVKAIVHVGSKQLDLAACEALFPGDPPWVIFSGTLQWFIDETDYKLLEKCAKGPQTLTKELVEQLEGCPHVHWQKKPQPFLFEPTPFLKLKDRTGAFADLWFDYGQEGKLAAEDPKVLSWRQKETEKGWEKDLLETDFIKKIVGTSHYYCPLDKVTKSLIFLLEIGWPLFDFQGKQIVRAAAAQLELNSSENALLVKGRVPNGEYQADLSQVLGAFVRRERFVELSPHAVGLLEPQAFWEDLAEEEIVSDTVVVRRSAHGILEDLFPQPVLDAALEEKAFELVEGSFQGKLHPYQQEGVEWLTKLYQASLHGLLADEMGLGKTVQAIAFFSHLPAIAPILIVAPTSLLFNWRKEFERFFPACSVYVHAGEERLKTKEELISKRVILTSYTLLRLDHALLQSFSYQCILLDEAQTIKNPDSQTARAAFSLRSQFRMAVTGTPVENRSEDLWSLFHFLMPELLGERKEFLAKLHAAEQDGRYLKNVRKKLRPFLLRRTKEAVLEDLPEKIEQTLWIEMGDEQKRVYEEYLQKARSGVLKKIGLEKSSASRLEVLEVILRLRQICCHPLLLGSEAPSAKLDLLLNDLEEVVAEGKKVLVYSQFTHMLQLIAKQVRERGWSYAYLDGSTENREAVVERFQNDPSFPIFLISLKAGGVGLNLTAADYVFLFDPWWNTAAEQQAIDRAHRIGRKGSILARRYAMAWSIEEKMMRLKEHKLLVSKGLLEFEESINLLSFDEIVNCLF